MGISLNLFVHFQSVCVPSQVDTWYIVTLIHVLAIVANFSLSLRLYDKLRLVLCIQLLLSIFSILGFLQRYSPVV